MFVVTATFTLKPGTRADFMPAILENARLSALQEPGCRRFDVCETAGAPEENFLYELYDDEAAFAVHKTMPHFHDFAAKAEPLVAHKTVKTHTLLNVGASTP